MKQLEVLQSQLLPLKKLKPNTGQIPGLPANPRRITDIQLARLKRSIQQNPEMLALSEIKVYPYKGEYIAIGGNQRIAALSGMSIKDVPCKLIPESATIDQLRAYIIEDNVEFDTWVDDILKMGWDAVELEDFGMEDVESLGLDNMNVELDVKHSVAPVAPALPNDVSTENSAMVDSHPESVMPTIVQPYNTTQEYKPESHTDQVLPEHVDSETRQLPHEDYVPNIPIDDASLNNDCQEHAAHNSGNQQKTHEVSMEQMFSDLKQTCERKKPKMIIVSMTDGADEKAVRCVVKEVVGKFKSAKIV